MHDGASQPASPFFDAEHEFEALAGDTEAQQRLIGRWLDASLKSGASRAFWELVQRRGGLAVGNLKFVADSEEVVRILQDDAQFKVTEYNRRMQATSGRFYLGMDDAEHAEDAKLGEIIPSWNAPDGVSHAPLASRATSADVARVAAEASRRLLAAVGARTMLARISDPDTKCQCLLAELVGVVLDANSSAFFGVPGPSALSLISWARDVTWYHFRVYANHEADRSDARRASAEYRAHVLDLIAKLGESLPQGRSGLVAQREALRRCVASIRRRLELQRGGAAVSDDDVARNLIGIITGSLTATAKSFGEGLSSFASRSHDPTGRIAWDGATCHGSSAPSYPLYERVIARSMQAEHRGAPDSLYRKYVGPDCSRSGQILKAGDTVVVWLGNGVHGDSERLFGVGVHKCPGKDMGKALMEGMLQTLSSLQGDDSPRISDMGGEAGLTFDHPEALVALANQR